VAEWLSSVRVGSESGCFGESECSITCFRGRVAQVHHNKTPIQHVSGGGGSVRGSSSLYHGNGGGYVSGIIDPVRSHTEIKTDFRMWVRSSENKDFSWSSDCALNVANGQELTLIFLNGKFVAYVNHNTDSWCYVMSDNRIADIMGQTGYLLANSDELKSYEESQKNGRAYGVVSGSITFMTAIFVERCDFWGWRWVERASSDYWYFLPGFLLVIGLVGMGKKIGFWIALIFSLAIGCGSWFFGYERWGAVAVLFFMLGVLYKPEEKYGFYVDDSVVATVKDAIFNNANYALRNFK
jgi:hypothetical protein